MRYLESEAIADLKALFVSTLVNDDHFCPFCHDLKGHLEIINSTLPAEFQIPIISVDSTDPRVDRLARILEKMGLELQSPVLVYNGKIYIGELGKKHFVGLIYELLAQNGYMR